MVFATVSGNPTEKETEEITSLWQSSLFNANFDIQRYSMMVFTQAGLSFTSIYWPWANPLALGWDVGLDSLASAIMMFVWQAAEVLLKLGHFLWCFSKKFQAELQK